MLIKSKLYKQNYEIKLSASGRGFVIFATLNGTVIILDKLLSLITFKAFDLEVHAINQLKNSDVLLVAGVKI